MPSPGTYARFGQMLTQLQGDQLPQGIKAVRAEDLPRLHAFVNGLERELAADQCIAGVRRREL
ncbi:hypothetical protein HW130_14260 [Streptomyces sp. PKU-EA00015]|uniref:hypothetical protein n=1 Tax=Streptomyces sp. PKU-EA00015 TaxID=2748326 RepID=UPI0015A25DB5|nr:hypothetical protein [Streptomyces sp. PKU-EA00015]NWF27417.1 hypothetical protein [Streptomyces sp. PKU-EA00015]